jgi:hypothetical protein
VTFYDDKNENVLGIGIIKINDHFTLNDVALMDKLRYNLFSVSQLMMLIWMCFFISLIRMFLTLLASVFVASLILVMSFKLISHSLNLL